jgi:hypothetical protein
MTLTALRGIAGAGLDNVKVTFRSWADAVAQTQFLRAVGDPRHPQPTGILGHSHPHRPAAVQIHAHDLPTSYAASIGASYYLVETDTWQLPSIRQ